MALGGQLGWQSELETQWRARVTSKYSLADKRSGQVKAGGAAA